ncbi:MAG: aminopeptidase P family protein, partial [Armatimonadetes bacterium]|nr:aminopeptidase P family protein [Armatimonadota bacterium]
FSSTFRPFTAVIPRESDPVLLLPNLELGLGRDTCWFADIRIWGGAKADYKDPLEAAKAVIDEKKLRRVGVEMSRGQRIGMTLEQWGQVQRLLPNVQWGDSADVLWRLRMVKSPTEVAYMREACRQTDAGIAAAVAVAREGASEMEMSVAMGTTMMKEGADTVRSLSIASGPKRYDQLNAPAVDRKLRRGEMVNMDCGCLYRGYHGDLTRGFFVGEASQRQRDFYNASLEIFYEAAQAVRPGITCEELDRVAEQAIVKRGYREYMLHRTGHSLGLEVHEDPSIGPGYTQVLEPGMVLAIEPGIYDFSIGAFRIEDNVVVTEKGFDYLSHAPRDLIIR